MKSVFKPMSINLKKMLNKKALSFSQPDLKYLILS